MANIDFGPEFIQDIRNNARKVAQDVIKEVFPNGTDLTKEAQANPGLTEVANAEVDTSNLNTTVGHEIQTRVNAFENYVNQFRGIQNYSNYNHMSQEYIDALEYGLRDTLKLLRKKDGVTRGFGSQQEKDDFRILVERSKLSEKEKEKALKTVDKAIVNARNIGNQIRLNTSPARMAYTSISASLTSTLNSINKAVTETHAQTTAAKANSTFGYARSVETGISQMYGVADASGAAKADNSVTHIVSDITQKVNVMKKQAVSSEDLRQTGAAYVQNQVNQDITAINKLIGDVEELRNKSQDNQGLHNIAEAQNTDIVNVVDIENLMPQNGKQDDKSADNTPMLTVAIQQYQKASNSLEKVQEYLYVRSNKQDSVNNMYKALTSIEEKFRPEQEALAKQLGFIDKNTGEALTGDQIKKLFGEEDIKKFLGRVYNGLDTSGNASRYFRNTLTGKNTEHLTGIDASTLQSKLTNNGQGQVTMAGSNIQGHDATIIKSELTRELGSAFQGLGNVKYADALKDIQVDETYLKGFNSEFLESLFGVANIEAHRAGSDTAAEAQVLNIMFSDPKFASQIINNTLKEAHKVFEANNITDENTRGQIGREIFAGMFHHYAEIIGSQVSQGTKIQPDSDGFLTYNLAGLTTDTLGQLTNVSQDVVTKTESGIQETKNIVQTLKEKIPEGWREGFSGGALSKRVKEAAKNKEEGVVKNALMAESVEAKIGAFITKAHSMGANVQIGVEQTGEKTVDLVFSIIPREYLNGNETEKELEALHANKDIAINFRHQIENNEGQLVAGDYNSYDALTLDFDTGRMGTAGLDALSVSLDMALNQIESQKYGKDARKVSSKIKSTHNKVKNGTPVGNKHITAESDYEASLHSGKEDTTAVSRIIEQQKANFVNGLGRWIQKHNIHEAVKNSVNRGEDFEDYDVPASMTIAVTRLMEVMQLHRENWRGAAEELAGEEGGLKALLSEEAFAPLVNAIEQATENFNTQVVNVSVNSAMGGKFVAAALDKTLHPFQMMTQSIAGEASQKTTHRNQGARITSKEELEKLGMEANPLALEGEQTKDTMMMHAAYVSEDIMQAVLDAQQRMTIEENLKKQGYSEKDIDWTERVNKIFEKTARSGAQEDVVLVDEAIASTLEFKEPPRSTDETSLEQVSDEFLSSLKFTEEMIGEARKYLGLSSNQSITNRQVIEALQKTRGNQGFMADLKTRVGKDTQFSDDLTIPEGSMITGYEITPEGIVAHYTTIGQFKQGMAVIDSNSTWRGSTLVFKPEAVDKVIREREAKGNLSEKEKMQLEAMKGAQAIHMETLTKRSIDSRTSAKRLMPILAQSVSKNGLTAEQYKKIIGEDKGGIENLTGGDRVRAQLAKRLWSLDDQGKVTVNQNLAIQGSKVTYTDENGKVMNAFEGITDEKGKQYTEKEIAAYLLNNESRILSQKEYEEGVTEAKLGRLVGNKTDDGNYIMGSFVQDIGTSSGFNVYKGLVNLEGKSLYDYMHGIGASADEEADPFRKMGQGKVGINYRVKEIQRQQLAQLVTEGRLTQSEADIALKEWTKQERATQKDVDTYNRIKIASQIRGVSGDVAKENGGYAGVKFTFKDTEDVNAVNISKYLQNLKNNIEAIDKNDDLTDKQKNADKEKARVEALAGITKVAEENLKQRGNKGRYARLGENALGMLSFEGLSEDEIRLLEEAGFKDNQTLALGRTDGRIKNVQGMDKESLRFLMNAANVAAGEENSLSDAAHNYRALMYENTKRGSDYYKSATSGQMGSAANLRATPKAVDQGNEHDMTAVISYDAALEVFGRGKGHWDANSLNEHSQGLLTSLESNIDTAVKNGNWEGTEEEAQAVKERIQKYRELQQALQEKYKKDPDGMSAEDAELMERFDNEITRMFVDTSSKHQLTLAQAAIKREPSAVAFHVNYGMKINTKESGQDSQTIMIPPQLADVIKGDFDGDVVQFWYTYSNNPEFAEVMQKMVMQPEAARAIYEAFNNKGGADLIKQSKFDFKMLGLSAQSLTDTATLAKQTVAQTTNKESLGLLSDKRTRTMQGINALLQLRPGDAVEDNLTSILFPNMSFATEQTAIDAKKINAHVAAGKYKVTDTEGIMEAFFNYKGNNQKEQDKLLEKYGVGTALDQKTTASMLGFMENISPEHQKDYAEYWDFENNTWAEGGERKIIDIMMKRIAEYNTIMGSTTGPGKEQKAQINSIIKANAELMNPALEDEEGNVIAPGANQTQVSSVKAKIKHRGEEEGATTGAQAQGVLAGGNIIATNVGITATNVVINGQNIQNGGGALTDANNRRILMQEESYGLFDKIQKEIGKLEESELGIKSLKVIGEGDGVIRYATGRGEHKANEALTYTGSKIASNFYQTDESWESANALIRKAHEKTLNPEALNDTKLVNQAMTTLSGTAQHRMQQLIDESNSGLTAKQLAERNDKNEYIWAATKGLGSGNLDDELKATLNDMLRLKGLDEKALNGVTDLQYRQMLGLANSEGDTAFAAEMQGIQDKLNAPETVTGRLLALDSAGIQTLSKLAEFATGTTVTAKNLKGEDVDVDIAAKTDTVGFKKREDGSYDFYSIDYKSHPITSNDGYQAIAEAATLRTQLLEDFDAYSHKSSQDIISDQTSSETALGRLLRSSSELAEQWDKDKEILRRGFENTKAVMIGKTGQGQGTEIKQFEPTAGLMQAFKALAEGLAQGIKFDNKTDNPLESIMRMAMHNIGLGVTDYQKVQNFGELDKENFSQIKGEYFAAMGKAGSKDEADSIRENFLKQQGAIIDKNTGAVLGFDNENMQARLSAEQAAIFAATAPENLNLEQLKEYVQLLQERLRLEQQLKDIQDQLDHNRSLDEGTEARQKVEDDKVLKEERLKNINEQIEKTGFESSPEKTPKYMGRELNRLEEAQYRQLTSEELAKNAPKTPGARGNMQGAGLITGALDRRLGMFLNYTLVNKALSTISQSFKKVKKNVEDLNKSLINLAIASGGSIESTQNMMKEYNKIALQIGVTTAEMAKAANDWLRAGYTGKQAAELTKASMYLSKLGMMDAGQATKSLISVLKGWKLSSEEVEGVVDRLVAVDMKAATSSGEIATAMSKVNNVAQMSGISMDKLVGIIANGIDVTQQSAETVGVAWRTIFSRLKNVKAGKYEAGAGEINSSEYSEADYEALNDVERVLQQVGISLRTNINTWKSTEDLLEEIASKWDNFNEVTRSAIATAIAGTRQQEQFNTAMRNWTSVKNLAEISGNSQGTTQRKMEVYEQGIEAARNRVAASWEKIATDGTGLENLVTGFLNNLSGLIENWATVLFSVLLGGITVLIIKLTASSTSLTSAFPQLSNAVQSLGGTFIKLKYTAEEIASMKGTAKQNAINTNTAMGMGGIAAVAAGTIGTGMLGSFIGKSIGGEQGESVGGTVGSMVGMAATTAAGQYGGWVGALIAGAVGVGMAIGTAIVQGMEAAHKAAVERITKQYNEIIDKGSSAKNLKQYAEIFDKYSSGVSSLGKNLALTDEEYQEYLQASQKLAETYPQLVTGMDENGNALLDWKNLMGGATEGIISMSTALEAYIANLEKQAAALASSSTMIKETEKNVKNTLENSWLKTFTVNKDLSMSWKVLPENNSQTASYNFSDFLKELSLMLPADALVNYIKNNLESEDYSPVMEAFYGMLNQGIVQHGDLSGLLQGMAGELPAYFNELLYNSTQNPNIKITWEAQYAKLIKGRQNLETEDFSKFLSSDLFALGLNAKDELNKIYTTEAANTVRGLLNIQEDFLNLSSQQQSLIMNNIDKMGYTLPLYLAQGGTVDNWTRQIFREGKDYILEHGETINKSVNAISAAATLGKYTDERQKLKEYLESTGLSGSSFGRSYITSLGFTYENGILQDAENYQAILQESYKVKNQEDLNELDMDIAKILTKNAVKWKEFSLEQATEFANYEMYSGLTGSQTKLGIITKSSNQTLSKRKELLEKLWSERDDLSLSTIVKEAQNLGITLIEPVASAILDATKSMEKDIEFGDFYSSISEAITTGFNSELIATQASYAKELLGSRITEGWDTNNNKLIDSFKELKNVLDDVANSYNKLKDAQKEQNKKGKLSLQTVLDLISSNINFAQCLDVSSKGIKLNSNAQKIMAKAQLEAAQAGIAQYIATTRSDLAILKNKETLLKSGITLEDYNEQTGDSSVSTNALSNSLMAANYAMLAFAESSKQATYEQQLTEKQTKKTSLQLELTAVRQEMQDYTGNITDKDYVALENKKNRLESQIAQVNKEIEESPDKKAKEYLELSSEYISKSEKATAIDNQAKGTINTSKEAELTDVQNQIADKENLLGILEKTWNDIGDVLENEDYAGWIKDYLTDNGFNKELLEKIQSVLGAINQEFEEMAAYTIQINKSLSSSEGILAERYFNSKKQLSRTLVENYSKKLGYQLPEDMEKFNPENLLKTLFTNTDDETFEDRLKYYEAVLQYYAQYKNADDEMIEYTKKRLDLLSKETTDEKIEAQKEYIETSDTELEKLERINGLNEMLRNQSQEQIDLEEARSKGMVNQEVISRYENLLEIIKETGGTEKEVLDAEEKIRQKLVEQLNQQIGIQETLIGINEEVVKQYKNQIALSKNDEDRAKAISTYLKKIEELTKYYATLYDLQNKLLKSTRDFADYNPLSITRNQLEAAIIETSTQIRDNAITALKERLQGMILSYSEALNISQEQVVERLGRGELNVTSEVVQAVEALDSAQRTLSSSIKESYDSVLNAISSEIEMLNSAKPIEFSNAKENIAFQEELISLYTLQAQKIQGIIRNEEKWRELTTEDRRSYLTQYYSTLNALREAEQAKQQSVIDEGQKVSDALIGYANELISQVEKEKEIITKAYDDEIKKLEDKNKSIERTNKLLEIQQKLLNAQQEKERVYRAGIGWVYESNRTKVKEAQKELEDFQRSDAIDDLNKAKEAETKLLEDRIEAWKKYTEMLEEQKNAQQKIENERILGSFLNAKTETEIRDKVLEDMKKFNEEYTSYVNELVKLTEDTNGGGIGTVKEFYSNWGSVYKDFSEDVVDAWIKMRLISELPLTEETAAFIQNLDTADQIEDLLGAINSDLLGTTGLRESLKEMYKGMVGDVEDELTNPYMEAMTNFKNQLYELFGLGEGSDGGLILKSYETIVQQSGSQTIDILKNLGESINNLAELVDKFFEIEEKASQAASEGAQESQEDAQQYENYMDKIIHAALNKDEQTIVENALWRDRKINDLDLSQYSLTNGNIVEMLAKDAKYNKKIVRATDLGTAFMDAFLEGNYYTAAVYRGMRNDKIRNNEKLQKQYGDQVGYTFDELVNELWGTRKDYNADAKKLTETINKIKDKPEYTEYYETLMNTLPEFLKAIGTQKVDEEIFRGLRDAIGILPENIKTWYSDHGMSYASGILGGPIKYTGLAMLHGTPSQPEYVLNSDQAYNLLANLALKHPEFDETNKGGENNYYSFGGITMNGVNDPEAFFKALNKAMDNRWSVTKNQK